MFRDGKDEDFIKIREDKPAEEITENIIYKSLKDSRCICKAKRP